MEFVVDSLYYYRARVKCSERLKKWREKRSLAGKSTERQWVKKGQGTGRWKKRKKKGGHEKTSSISLSFSFIVNNSRIWSTFVLVSTGSKAKEKREKNNLFSQVSLFSSQKERTSWKKCVFDSLPLFYLFIFFSSPVFRLLTTCFLSGLVLIKNDFRPKLQVLFNYSIPCAMRVGCWLVSTATK